MNSKSKGKAGLVVTLVIVGLIIAALVGVYFIYSAKTDSVVAGKNELAKTGYSDPDSYEKGKGIYVSHKGVGQLDNSLPTFEVYMDYTCSHCAHFDREYGKEISDLVKSGKMNVIYRPVNVLRQQYSAFVANAMLQVVNSDDKDKYLDFQHKVSLSIAEYFDTKDPSKISNENLLHIAKDSGLSDEVIKSFADPKYKDYIDVALKRWDKRPLFEGQSIGTPSFVLDGKIITYGQIRQAGGIAKIIANNA